MLINNLYLHQYKLKYYNANEVDHLVNNQIFDLHWKLINLFLNLEWGKKIDEI